MRALIGHTGFVGGNLIHAGRYDAQFNSSNSEAMRGGHFREVVCAGISAVKWKANQEPEIDQAAIDVLVENLKHVTADRFVLLSTTDVYQDAIGVTERDPTPNEGAPYGVHRAAFERFIAKTFANHLIIRLPALYGRGLKKNAIFDLRYNNMVDAIDARGSFQWYDVRRLERDIKIITDANLTLINIAPQPVTMSAIADRFFPGKLRKPDLNNPAASYDMRTIYAGVLGGANQYHFDRETVLNGIGSYLESGE
ncbi:NAD(P)-dependent oxidoreductase [Methylobacterium sp. J-043]|nr:NAD(P)-dependent oxidoreductase [Methylobacterium sp. J-043]